MKMKKLELKHLAAYLPYNVNAFNINTRYVNPIRLGFHSESYCTVNELLTTKSDTYKLLLRPLPDLTKEIEVNKNKFIPVIELMDLYGITLELNEKMHLIQPITLEPYILIRQLFEWHFDVFGLIKEGLAIDINTLNK